MIMSQTPEISAKDPMTICNPINNALKPNGAENKPLKLSEEGIMTTAMETVFNITAMPITAPCFVNPRLNLAIDTPAKRKMKIGDLK